MDESELELPDSELDQKRSEFGQFPVVRFRDYAVGHHELPAFGEISNALNDLLPCPGRLDFGVVGGRVKPVDGRSEFVRPGRYEPIEIRFIGEFSTIGLDLDAFVSDFFREGDGGQQSWMHGRFSPGKDDGTKSFVEFGFERSANFFERALGIPLPFVALYAKRAKVVASETHFHVDSLHFLNGKMLRPF